MLPNLLARLPRVGSALAIATGWSLANRLLARVLARLQRSPHWGGRKDGPMFSMQTSEGGSAPPVGGTPPSTPHNLERRLDALSDAVERLVQSQQALVDGLAMPPATPVASAASSAEPSAMALSPDQVKRLVADALRERETAQTRSAARERWVRERMADLPEAYRRQLPETDDPAALAQAEQALRQQYRDDFRIAGPPTPSIGGDAGGAAPGEAVDYSRLSPLQQIGLGLSRTPVVRATAARKRAARKDAATAEPVGASDEAPASGAD